MRRRSVVFTITFALIGLFFRVSFCILSLSLMFESLCFLSLLNNLFFSSFNCMFYLSMHVISLDYLHNLFMSMFPCFSAGFQLDCPLPILPKRYTILHFRLIKFHINQKNQFLTLLTCNFFCDYTFFFCYFFLCQSLQQLLFLIRLARV